MPCIHQVLPPLPGTACFLHCHVSNSHCPSGSKSRSKLHLTQPSCVCISTPHYPLPKHLLNCIIMVYLWALLPSYDPLLATLTPRAGPCLCTFLCPVPSMSGIGAQPMLVTNKPLRWNIIGASIRGEEHGLWHQTAWLQVLVLPFTSDVCVGKLQSLLFNFLMYKIEIMVQLSHRIVISNA